MIISPRRRKQSGDASGLSSLLSLSALFPLVSLSLPPSSSLHISRLFVPRSVREEGGKDREVEPRNRPFPHHSLHTASSEPPVTHFPRSLRRRLGGGMEVMWM